MYLFKPFKTQEECDIEVDKLLNYFSSDREKIKIASFLGRYEVTRQYLKDTKSNEFNFVEYETRKDMFMDNPINKEE